MMNADLLATHYDPKDPDPWLALALDQSLPMDPDAKAALLRGAASWSRRWMFNVIKPFIFVFFVLVKILRGLSPRYPNLNGALHRTIHWGLAVFGSPGANLLILRHFHVGTELLAFIKANAGEVDVHTVALRPRTLKDLEDNVFLQHDLNVFNFIIQMNISLRAQNRDLVPLERPDFSMITDGPFDIGADEEELAQFRRRADGRRGLHAALRVDAAPLRFHPRVQFAAIGRAGGHLSREDPGHGLPSRVHQERPSDGAALDAAGGLSADDARARLRGHACLAPALEAPPGPGPAARSTLPDGVIPVTREVRARHRR
jgi:hypothetical protein